MYDIQIIFCLTFEIIALACLVHYFHGTIVLDFQLNISSKFYILLHGSCVECNLLAALLHWDLWCHLFESFSIEWCAYIVVIPVNEILGWFINGEKFNFVDEILGVFIYGEKFNAEKIK